MDWISSLLPSVLAVLLAFFFPMPQDFPAEPGIPSPSTQVSYVPVRILISKIRVDAAIEPVGVISDGTMGIPKNFTSTAWFEPGVLPGEIGSAVIAGHFGSIGGKKGAFDELRFLRKGDVISVQDESWAVTDFIVRELRTYDHTTIAPEAFVSDDGKSHLNLITCTGTWNRSQKKYQNRLVVFTDKK